jgi:hypothetical protein
MDAATVDAFRLDDSFARELVGLHQPWEPAPVADPQLVVLNEALATELDIDVDTLRSPDGLSILAGNASPAGVTTVAQAYAGHQFGGYSPRLGDGRALLLGELVDDGGSTTRPSPERIRQDSLCPRRRRSGRSRSDAARVPDGRSDACARHPDHAGTGGRVDR